MKTGKYKSALVEISQIIGRPCSDNTCGGCRYEMDAVVGVLTKILGTYEQRLAGCRKLRPKGRRR
jgi:hypothetical protein